MSNAQKAHLTIISKDLLFLCIASMVIFFFFLELYPMASPDEGRYGEIAREMLAAHNFITPTLNGVPFLDKPPLYYWLTAFIMHWGGVHEWSARAVSAFFGMLGLLGIYLTGYLLDNRRTGLIAAGILVSMPLYFLSAHFANCDLMVAVCMSLALFSALIAIMRPDLPHYRLCVYLAYFWCALAILAKGLIGLALPALIIGLFIILFKQWFLLLRMQLISGLIIVAVITLPWFILVSHANPDFLHYFFYVQHFERFTSSHFNNQHAFWFYIPILIGGSWPWCLYLFHAIKNYKNKNHADKQLDGYLLIWITVVLLFFSIPTSKSAGYILVFFPPLALFIARYISNLNIKLTKTPVIISIVSLFVGGLTLIIHPHIFPITKSHTTTLCLGTALLITGFFSLYLYRQMTFKAILIIPITLILLLSMLFLSFIKTKDSAEKVAMWLRIRQISPGFVYVYERYPFDVPFYLRSPVNVVYSNWQNSALSLKDSWAGEFALGLEQTHKPVPYFINNDTLLTRWHANQPIFLIVSNHLLASFEEQAGTATVNMLYHDKKWWLVTDEAGSCLLSHCNIQPQ